MNKTTRNLAFAAFYVALAFVLNYWNTLAPIIQMPNGGSLELSVIALFLASYHLGWKWGSGIALLSWVLGVMFGMNNYMVSFPQTFLDYIAPVLFIGLASLMPRIHLGNFTLSNVYTGVFAGMFLKYASHVLAGVYFWFPEGSAAGSGAAWIYSALTYNLGYNALTLVVALIIVPILVKRLNKISTVTFIGLKD